MNEEFYSIGRGSLNINGKFYYGLDYEITDFMRSLEEENKQLKEQQKEFTNYLKSMLSSEKDNFSVARVKDVLEILDNKGDNKNEK